MRLAINYSHQAAELVRQDKIQVDYFKCPAWENTILVAQEIGAVYIHLPLGVGQGLGDAVDMETQRPPDWEKIETLIAQTKTSYINLHLGPNVKYYPDGYATTLEPAHIEIIANRVLRDVHAVTQRFGSKHVILENVPRVEGEIVLAALLPSFINQIVKKAGCGFLLDVGHARIAAQHLDMNTHEYLSALPVESIREIHVTGVRRFDDRLVALLKDAKLNDSVIQRYAGHWQDHLAMDEEDWQMSKWAFEQICNNKWAKPWLVAFEYGGIGKLWEAVTETDVLLEQVPRLHQLLQDI